MLFLNQNNKNKHDKSSILIVPDLIIPFAYTINYLLCCGGIRIGLTNFEAATFCALFYSFIDQES
jgi:hypothetical protein